MLWAAIVLTGLVSFALKAAGPALGPRALPDRGRRVVVRLAPALLAALVVTDVVGPRGSAMSAALPAGLAGAAAVWWRRHSPIAAVFAAAVLTALVRAIA